MEATEEEKLDKVKSMIQDMLKKTAKRANLDNCVNSGLPDVFHPPQHPHRLDEWHQIMRRENPHAYQQANERGTLDCEPKW